MRDLIVALTSEDGITGDGFGFSVRQRRDPGAAELPQVDAVKPGTPAARRMKDKERILQVNSTVRKGKNPASKEQSRETASTVSG